MLFNFWVKIKLFTGENISETEQKDCCFYLGKVYKLKEPLSYFSTKITSVPDPKLGLKDCTENVSFSLQWNKERILKIKV